MFRRPQRRRQGQRRLGRSAGLAAVLAIPIFSPLADAASFSCNAPAGAREQLICRDSTLSHADEALAAAYKRALDALSEDGREALRRGQRQWLSFTQTVCWIGKKAPAGESSRGCLKDEYAKRQKQLDAAVIRRGGLAMRRVDSFSVASSYSPETAVFPFNKTTISFPQIDKPRNQSEEAWNKLIAGHEHDGETLANAQATASDDGADDFDLSVDYELGGVSPRMISLWLSICDFAHGAHGTRHDEGVTWLLGEGRASRAEDVFEAHKAWGEALARLVLAQQKQEAEDPRSGCHYMELGPSDIADDVSDPAHWLIDERALVVCLVSGICGVEATIPWSRTKPYLRSPMPFSTSS